MLRNDPTNAMTSSSLLCRIAVLETELKQQQEETVAAQKVNQYLLQQLVQGELNGTKAEIKLVDNLNRTTIENRVLKDRMRQKRKLYSFTRRLSATEGTRQPQFGCKNNAGNETEHLAVQKTQARASAIGSGPSLSPLAPIYTPSECSFSTTSDSSWEPATYDIVRASAAQLGQERSSDLRKNDTEITSAIGPASGEGRQRQELSNLVHAGPRGDLNRSIWALPTSTPAPKRTHPWPTMMPSAGRSNNVSSKLPGKEVVEDVVHLRSKISDVFFAKDTDASSAISDQKRDTSATPMTTRTKSVTGVEEDLMQFSEDTMNSIADPDVQPVRTKRVDRSASGMDTQGLAELTTGQTHGPIKDSLWAVPPTSPPRHSKGRAAHRERRPPAPLTGPSNRASLLRKSTTKLVIGLSEDIKYTRSMLMYQPKEGESGYHRTVLVQHIPPTIPVGTILSCVRGGLVVTARPMNTAFLTGYNTLTITFLKEKSARDFADYAKTHTLEVDVGAEHIKLGTGSFHTTTFTLLHSATWPLNGQELQRIEVDKHTRCLAIHRLDEEITMTALCNVLAEAGTKHHAIINAGRGSLGTVHLEFASIVGAERAKERSANHPWFRGASVEFSEDPCNQPLPSSAVDAEDGVHVSGYGYETAAGSAGLHIGTGDGIMTGDQQPSRFKGYEKSAPALTTW